MSSSRREDFILDIEDIDFHVIYDHAVSDARQGGAGATGNIPKTRIERVDEGLAHGEVPGTEAYEIRKGDAAADEVEIIPEDSAQQQEERSTKVGDMPIPTTRIERVDEGLAHGEVPGTEAYEIRRGDAVADEMEVIPEISEAKRAPFVLLSHALMANSTMWDSTVTALTSVGYDVIRYDHLGHGGTGKQKGEWRERKWHFDDFTRHMHTIVQKVRVGEQPAAVVGCSMGGVLAVRYAMLYPPARGEMLKVVCIGAPGLKSLEESKEKWEERKKVFRYEGVGVLAKMTAERWFPEPVGRGVRETAEGMCVGTTLEGYERCAEGIVNYDYEGKGEVEVLKNREDIEILVVRGENDGAVGPQSLLVDFAERVGGRFVGMQDVGHLPPMHDNEGFEKVLMGFLGK